MSDDAYFRKAGHENAPGGQPGAAVDVGKGMGKPPAAWLGACGQLLGNRHQYSPDRVSFLARSNICGSVSRVAALAHLSSAALLGKTNHSLNLFPVLNAYIAVTSLFGNFEKLRKQDEGEKQNYDQRGHLYHLQRECKVLSGSNVVRASRAALRVRCLSK